MTTPFQERVYDLLRTVPRGKVTTYGDLARVLRTSSRAVGQALRCNPYAPVVPCHRVVRSDGTIGGFNGRMSGTQVQKKIGLLAKEGVPIRAGEVIAFATRRHAYH